MEQLAARWARLGPACMLAHDMANKLAVIIGNCELLDEQVEPGSECAMRLGLIRKTAEGMAKEVNRHQCKISEAIRRSSH
jgi:nitrogen-specific signal transduction histidine kinase